MRIPIKELKELAKKCALLDRPQIDTEEGKMKTPICIVGCYTLHLYCINAQVNTGEPDTIHLYGEGSEDFTGHTEFECFNAARKAGWTIDKKKRTALCHACFNRSIMDGGLTPEMRKRVVYQGMLKWFRDRDNSLLGKRCQGATYAAIANEANISPGRATDAIYKACQRSFGGGEEIGPLCAYCPHNKRRRESCVTPAASI